MSGQSKFAVVRDNADGRHRMHYLEYAPGKSESPLIFLHGFTLDYRSWLADAEHFSADYHVIVPDAIGHGKSDNPPTNYSRADRVSDCFALMSQLKIEKAHIVGLSMGGSTAIGMALADQNRLTSMTLVDTGAAGYSPGKKVEMIDRMVREKGLETARERWAKNVHLWYNEDQQHIAKLLKTMMDDHSGAIWLDPQRGKYPRTYDLEHIHKIRIPTLIMVGAADRIFVPLAEQLHAKIENSRFFKLEGAGHMLNLEAPERFRAELSSFLESL